MTAAEQITTSPNLPRRRGKATATLRLEQAIVGIVAERAPITVRGVCYALFTQGLLPDMSVNSTGKVSRVMTDMRERDDLGVTFRVMKGFGSFTAVRQAAEDSLLLPDDRDGVVLYIGDWDPSGLYMSEVDLPQRLDRYGSRWQFERIALVEDDLHDLPHFDTATKAGDVRARWFAENTTADPAKSWELDAMDPNDLRDRVRDEIESYMDSDVWDRALQIEAKERESMQEFHEAWTARLARRRCE